MFAEGTATRVQAWADPDGSWSFRLKNFKTDCT